MPPKLDEGSETCRVNIMAPQVWLDAVEEWRRRQPRIPTKSEAIRIIVSRYLQAERDPRTAAAVHALIAEELQQEAEETCKE